VFQGTARPVIERLGAALSSAAPASIVTCCAMNWINLVPALDRARLAHWERVVQQGRQLDRA
jgi:hypothetical protein